MRLFSRVLGDDPASRGAADDPVVSPQGWVDVAGTWPEARRLRYGRIFATPGDALEELRRLGDALEARRDPARAGERALATFGREARPELESYAEAVQALQLGSEHLHLFKGTLGAVATVVAGHLDAIPEVTTFKLTGSYLKNLGEDLRDADDPDLAGLGQELLHSLVRVRKARVAAPATPAADLPAGTTATAAEMFRAQYEPAEGEPRRSVYGAPDATAEEEDAPLPPGDLTAEAVFKTLLEECLRDGRFSRAETRAVLQIRRLLEIPLARHTALLAEVEEELAAGKLAGEEDMDPLEFFERCCRRALADGVVRPAEKALLEKVGRYLHVTPEEFAEIRARVVG